MLCCAVIERSLCSISFTFFPLRYTELDQQRFYRNRIASGKGGAPFLVRTMGFRQDSRLVVTPHYQHPKEPNSSRGTSASVTEVPRNSPKRTHAVPASVVYCSEQGCIWNLGSRLLNPNVHSVCMQTKSRSSSTLLGTETLKTGV